MHPRERRGFPEEEGMRIWTVTCMTALLSVWVGCASEPSAGMDPPVFATCPTEPPPARHASALLFDRHPGPYRAGDFNYRSDWPSTEAYHGHGEVIYFAERFIDIQGPGFRQPDNTWRRFDTVRVGVGRR